MIKSKIMIKKLGTTDHNGDRGEIAIKSKITIKKSEHTKVPEIARFMVWSGELNVKINFFWLYQALPGFIRLDWA